MRHGLCGPLVRCWRNRLLRATEIPDRSTNLPAGTDLAPTMPVRLNFSPGSRDDIRIIRTQVIRRRAGEVSMRTRHPPARAEIADARRPYFQDVVDNGEKLSILHLKLEERESMCHLLEPSGGSNIQGLVGISCLLHSMAWASCSSLGRIRTGIGSARR